MSCGILMPKYVITALLTYFMIGEVYSNVKATVRTDEGLTDFFECKLGVRQGCMLSPRLFIIFISELQKMLKKSKFRTI